MESMYYIGLDVHKRKISYCVKDSGGSPEIMWHEFRDSQFCGVFLNDMPDHFLSYLCTPYSSSPTDAPEQFALPDVSRIQPIVDRPLHPVGHGDSPDVDCLSNEVNDGPVIFTAL